MENVCKMVKSQGKVRKKSGNFEIENEWQPCRRAIALIPAVLAAVALTKMLKFYVKVFKTLYFLNPQMDLVYI